VQEKFKDFVHANPQLPVCADAGISDNSHAADVAMTRLLRKYLSNRIAVWNGGPESRMAGALGRPDRPPAPARERAHRAEHRLSDAGRGATTDPGPAGFRGEPDFALRP
jgi:hypothetical protein